MSVYWLRFKTSVAPYETAGLSPTFINFAKYDGTTMAPPGITAPFASLGIYQFTYSPSFSVAFVVDGATAGLDAADRYIAGSLDPNDNNNTDILNLGSTLVGAGNTLSILALQSTVQGIGSTQTYIATQQANMGSTLVSYGNSLSVLALQTTLTNTGSTLVAIGNTLAGIGITVSSGVGDGATILARIGTVADSFGDSGTDPTTLFGLAKRAQEGIEGQGEFAKATGIWQIKSRGGSLLSSRTLSNNSSTVTKA